MTARRRQGLGATASTRRTRACACPAPPARKPLSVRNANTMWMLHFLSHLKDPTAARGGRHRGFVMATGELSNSETARLAVRRALVEGGFVDCVVTLTGSFLPFLPAPTRTRLEG